MNKVSVDRELIKSVLREISKNEYKHFKPVEIMQFSPEKEHVLSWFEERENNTKACTLCFGKSCRVEFIPSDDFLPCPYGESEIIDITKNDRIGYVFKMTKFLTEIQQVLEINGEIERLDPFYVIGEKKVDKDNWLITFSLAKHLEKSLGSALEINFKRPSLFTLLILDEIPKYVVERQELLRQLGIFYITWDKLEINTIKSTYDTYSDELQVRKALITIEDQVPLEKVSVSKLWKYATAGNKGDQFEDSVLQIIQKVFYNVIPFGSLYKGVSIPDGLIMQKQENITSTLFYDCKSFKGEEFRHKAATPMQVNYYQDFLEAFYNQGYQDCGFIIFSSEYPEDVKRQITGSAQWRYVQEKNKIYFINVTGLERLNLLLTEFPFNNSFDSKSFFCLLFEQKLSYIIAEDLKEIYTKLFITEPQNNFFFISPEQIEVALIISMLEKVSEHYGDEGIRKHLKLTIKKAQHTNKIRERIRTPQNSRFIEKMISILEGKEEMELHPLSMLIFLNHQEDEMYMHFGENKYEEFLDHYQIKLH